MAAASEVIPPKVGGMAEIFPYSPVQGNGGNGDFAPEMTPFAPEIRPHSPIPVLLQPVYRGQAGPDYAGRHVWYGGSPRRIADCSNNDWVFCSSDDFHYSCPDGPDGIGCATHWKEMYDGVRKTSRNLKVTAG